LFAFACALAFLALTLFTFSFVELKGYNKINSKIQAFYYGRKKIKFS